MWNNISKQRDCVGLPTEARKRKNDIKLNYRRKWKPFMDNISLQFSGEMCACDFDFLLHRSDGDTGRWQWKPWHEVRWESLELQASWSLIFFEFN